jgi:hypothetical protein
LLYWQVGQRIRTDILKQMRAAYGEQIVPTLSAQLVPEFGQGFAKRNLFRMIRFAEAFPDPQIVSVLSKQLGWSHFVEIIPLDDNLKRDFYAEMCRIERWSVRTLHAKIRGMRFERTALSREPALLAQQELAVLRNEDRLSPDLVFRDPYFLDFLGLADTYSGQDVETAGGGQGGGGNASAPFGPAARLSAGPIAHSPTHEVTSWSTCRPLTNSPTPR